MLVAKYLAPTSRGEQLAAFVGIAESTGSTRSRARGCSPDDAGIDTLTGRVSKGILILANGPVSLRRRARREGVAAD
jgi:hypothetical protein